MTIGERGKKNIDGNTKLYTIHLAGNGRNDTIYFCLNKSCDLHMQNKIDHSQIDNGN